MSICPAIQYLHSINESIYQSIENSFMNRFLHESTIKYVLIYNCYSILYSRIISDHSLQASTSRNLVRAIDQTPNMTLTSPQPSESYLHHHLPSIAQLPTWRIMTVDSPAFGTSSRVKNSPQIVVIWFLKVEKFIKIKG